MNRRCAKFWRGNFIENRVKRVSKESTTPRDAIKWSLFRVNDDY